MKKKSYDFNKNNIFIITALIVGIGISYVAINQVYSTGEVVASRTCVDSDGGLNYEEEGLVTYRGSRYTDSCTGNTLIERYCKENSPTSLRFKCKDGCYSGKCGDSSCDNECTSLGAKQCVPTNTGMAYKTCGKYDTDSCLDWSSLTYCPAGYTCSNGNCVSPSRQ